MGDESLPFVKDGNDMACLGAYHVLVADFVEIESVLEQPLSSRLERLEFVANAFTATHAERTVTPLGAFDADSFKQVQLWHCSSTARLLGSGSWVRALKRPIPRHFKFRKLYHQVNGKVNGIHKRLKASAAYPPRFGAAVAQGLLIHFGTTQ